MEEHLIEGFVIQAMMRGLSRRNGTTTTVIDVTSENNASAETQVVPKRKRYRVPTNEECLRLVESHTKELGKDVDTTCMLCCDNKVQVELIHSVCKGGDGKENNCLNNRFCKSCIEQSIAAQETRQSVILPQCPCCKQRISKMVQLEDNVVLNLPPFKPEGVQAVLRNAQDANLVFAYNATGTSPNVKVLKWEILARDFVEADVAKEESYRLIKTIWPTIWNHTMYSMVDQHVIGWPDCRMMLRAINIKLKEINRSNLNWLPKVYGGSMQTPTDLGILRKRKKVTVSVTTSDGSGAGSSSSSSTSRTVRLCDCSACVRRRERERTCDCSSCVRRRAKEAKEAKKKRKKKRKKKSKKTE